MIPASVRIFVCTRPLDMRCSYDTLALAAHKVLGCYGSVYLRDLVPV